MKIYPPDLVTAQGWTTLTAQVELPSTLPDLPDQIWYAFPEQYGGMVQAHADPFVTALLPFAMFKGEALHVCGSLSTQLAYNLDRYQKILHAWKPDMFQPIELTYERLEQRRSPSREQAVASLFSGGIDSMYTLGSHLPEHQSIPQYQVSHVIFMDRFDLNPYGESGRLRTAAAFESLLNPRGIQVIAGRSNLRDLVEKMSKREMQLYRFLTTGSFLASIGQVLSAGVKRLLIPSTYTFLRTLPVGSDMRLDQLLGTERLEIIHHGVTRLRAQKLESIGAWSLSHDHLRVCWWGADGVQNCCECPKCIRTMITLRILGTESSFNTFSKPLPIRHIHRAVTTGGYRFMRENYQLALERRRWRMAALSGYLAIWCRAAQIAKAVVQRLRPNSRRYW
jgi:hypothetical protein